MNHRLYILIFCFVLFSSIGITQISSHSPYTIYGLGELNQNTNVVGLSLGGTGIANVDSINLNTLNPAMYAFIPKGKPILDVSGEFKFSRFETVSDKLDGNRFTLQNIALSIPIKQNWGLTFGLSPYSKVGYKIQERTVFDEQDVKTSYIGTGSFNKAFVGLAYRPWNDSLNQLSIGFNIGYLFGTVSRSRSNEFVNENGYLNTKAKESLRFNDFFFDAGLIYYRKLSSNSSISFGFNYSLGKNTRVEKEDFVHGFTGGLGSESNIDTISYTIQKNGKIFIPHKFGFGISYELFGDRYNKRNKLDYLLKINIDYSMQDWTKFTVNFNTKNSNDILLATNRVSLGVEFTPSLNVLNRPKVNYGKTMIFRIGGHYSTLPYQVKNTQIKDFGISFGLGFPVPIKYTNASLNLGMNLGQVGTIEKGLVRERYIGTYIGLSLSPSVKWFQRRKYD